MKDEIRAMRNVLLDKEKTLSMVDMLVDTALERSKERKEIEEENPQHRFIIETHLRGTTALTGESVKWFVVRPLTCECVV